MLKYYILMLEDGKPYEYCFVSEGDAVDEAYKMGITNVYVYSVIVAT